MAPRNDGHTVDQHFAKSAPHVRAIYEAILARAQRLGPVGIEPKKTSIHLVRDSAFAGVATRKDALILTLKAPAAIRSNRVRRAELASAHRWHVEFRLESPKDVDREMTSWLTQAYDMSGPRVTATTRAK